MSIRAAIGLGILILVLKFLVPAILSEGQNTILAFLRGATVSATVASDLAASVHHARLPQSLPAYDPLPQTRQIVPF